MNEIWTIIICWDNIVMAYACIFCFFYFWEEFGLHSQMAYWWLLQTYEEYLEVHSKSIKHLNLHVSILISQYLNGLYMKAFFVNRSDDLIMYNFLVLHQHLMLAACDLLLWISGQIYFKTFVISCFVLWFVFLLCIL